MLVQNDFGSFNQLGNVWIVDALPAVPDSGAESDIAEKPVLPLSIIASSKKRRGRARSFLHPLVAILAADYSVDFALVAFLGDPAPDKSALAGSLLWR